MLTMIIILVLLGSIGRRGWYRPMFGYRPWFGFRSWFGPGYGPRPGRGPGFGPRPPMGGPGGVGRRF